MSFTRRFGSGRGRLSLRSRLLAGLITVTALFLVVMGVVTTVVLGHSEQGQFNTDLLLTAKSTPKEIANAANGYVAANVSARTGQVTCLRRHRATRPICRNGSPAWSRREGHTPI